MATKTSKDDKAPEPRPEVTSAAPAEAEAANGSPSPASPASRDVAIREMISTMVARLLAEEAADGSGDGDPDADRDAEVLRRRMVEARVQQQLVDRIYGQISRAFEAQRREICKEAKKREVTVEGCSEEGRGEDFFAFLANPMVAAAVNTGALVAGSPKATSGVVGWALPALPVAGAVIANLEKGGRAAARSAVAPAVIGGLALFLRHQFG